LIGRQAAVADEIVDGDGDRIVGAALSINGDVGACSAVEDVAARSANPASRR
jgi:hypothetical protein